MVRRMRVPENSIVSTGDWMSRSAHSAVEADFVPVCTAQFQTPPPFSLLRYRIIISVGGNFRKAVALSRSISSSDRLRARSRKSRNEGFLILKAVDGKQNSITGYPLLRPSVGLMA